MTPAACALLAELRADNRREWLRANRDRYDTLVADPLEDALEALAPSARAVDPDLEPSRSRPYRDARYARPGRGPLHEAAWVVFRNRRLEQTLPPVFFLEVSPDGFGYGMGYYRAPAWRMAAIRAAIDAAPGEFRRAARDALSVPGLQVCGDFYARPKGAHLAEDLRTWYDRKNVWVEVSRDPDDPPDLGRVAQAFTALQPLYRFWRDARAED